MFHVTITHDDGEIRVLAKAFETYEEARRNAMHNSKGHSGILSVMEVRFEVQRKMVPATHVSLDLGAGTPVKAI